MPTTRTPRAIQDLLVPVRTWKPARGKLVLPGTPLLASMLEADALPLGQLKDEMKNAGMRARLSMGAPKATVLLRRNLALGAEAYRLSIRKDGVTLTAATDAGAYYGVQTLIDLVRLCGKELPCGEIEDSPSLRRRGVYEDCARGKVPSVATVKQLIEWLAHWKINELQLYIENAFDFKTHPGIGKGFSPYKPKDILAIQEHAKLHHMRFVPSLTSFGHFEKVLMAPGLARLGELPGSRGFPGGTTLCPGDPDSIKLLDDMYGEFLPLFEADEFNVCGDEPWELGLGRSKRRAQRVGVARVYLDFMLKIRSLCHKYGKSMSMWADIAMKHPEMLPDLPKDVCLMNWQYGKAHDRIDRSHEMRDAGLSFVCCSGTSNWASHGSRLQDALVNVQRFAKAARENDSEGLIHTDWGNGGHRNYLGTSLCSLAHGAAHAWCGEKMDDKKYVRRFADIVFGDPDGKLAAGITKLGESPIGIGQPQYFALTECLIGPKPLANGTHVFDGFRMENILAMDRAVATPAAIAKRAADVRAIKWPRPTRKLNGFLALAMQEFAAAAHMEGIGSDHINLARDVRAGKAKAADLRKHADDLLDCAKEHERLWRARNRPSRLCDNLALLRGGAKEARKLAAKS